MRSDSKPKSTERHKIKATYGKEQLTPYYNLILNHDRIMVITVVTLRSMKFHYMLFFFIEDMFVTLII